MEERCNWCKNKNIGYNIFHHNCESSGYSSFEATTEINCESLYNAEDLEKLRKKLRNGEYKGILFPEPIEKFEFIDIRVGYNCIKNSKDLNTISVFGITKNHEIVLIKTVSNAEYGSFSIKDCINDWDKFKEVSKDESK